MPPVSIHPPDANHPKGMAWVLGVGFVDSRPGNHPNQPGAILQCWEPTSELYWELGLRWHPELATKWAVGGGQFQVSEILSEKPEVEEAQTLEAAAEEVLEFLAGEDPKYAKLLKDIHELGSDEERAKYAKQYEDEIKKLITLSQYITSKPQE